MLNLSEISYIYLGVIRYLLSATSDILTMGFAPGRSKGLNGSLTQRQDARHGCAERKPTPLQKWGGVFICANSYKCLRSAMSGQMAANKNPVRANHNRVVLRTYGKLCGFTSFPADTGKAEAHQCKRCRLRNRLTSNDRNIINIPVTGT